MHGVINYPVIFEFRSDAVDLAQCIAMQTVHIVLPFAVANTSRDFSFVISKAKK